jgi:hypothetical protein
MFFVLLIKQSRVFQKESTRISEKVGPNEFISEGRKHKLVGALVHTAQLRRKTKILLTSIKADSFN